MIKDYLIKYINKYKKIGVIVLITIILCVIAYFIISFYGSKEVLNDNKENNDIKELGQDNIQEIPKEIVNYYVDIKGSVVNPGVYKVEEGSRVIDVIYLAGGLTKDADTSIINLSKKITDEMIIIIYTKNQIKQYKSKTSSNNIKTIIAYIDKEYNCPDVGINEACINNNTSSDTSNNDTDNKIPSKVSINYASSSELQTLAGIGPSKAEAIISYRNLNGLFKNIEELKNVSGIGDSTFDKIKDSITL